MQLHRLIDPTDENSEGISNPLFLFRELWRRARNHCRVKSATQSQNSFLKIHCKYSIPVTSASWISEIFLSVVHDSEDFCLDHFIEVIHRDLLFKIFHFIIHLAARSYHQRSAVEN